MSEVTFITMVGGEGGEQGVIFFRWCFVQFRMGLVSTCWVGRRAWGWFSLGVFMAVSGVLSLRPGPLSFPPASSLPPSLWQGQPAGIGLGSMIWEGFSDLSDSVMAQREGWVGDATAGMLQQHGIPTILLHPSPFSLLISMWDMGKVPAHRSVHRRAGMRHSQTAFPGSWGWMLQGLRQC